MDRAPWQQRDGRDVGGVGKNKSKVDNFSSNEENETMAPGP